MQDIATFRRRTHTIQLKVDCPVCNGRGRVSLPSHDGTIERGYRSPAGNTQVDEDCGCVDGQVELLVDMTFIEDAVADALGPVIDYVTRHLHRDDREWIRDDISTSLAAREIVAGLDVTIAKREVERV